jgi:hypothetical protein
MIRSALYLSSLLFGVDVIGTATGMVVVLFTVPDLGLTLEAALVLLVNATASSMNRHNPSYKRIIFTL